MSIRRYAAALALALGLTAACGSPSTPLPPTAPPTSTAPTTPAPTSTAQPCTDALTSYAPAATLPGPGAMPDGSTMRAIQKRGRLIAGVSADTYLFAARNPVSGQIEGFDIDVVKAITKAIFGDETKYQLRVITAADRIPLLQQHKVDVVVRTFSITCDRWQQIAFSAEYYRAGQKILVTKGSDVTDLAGLAGKRVCAPAGTSSMTTLVQDEPDAVAVAAPNHTGCLVKFQEGQVDAITGDDTVLAGLAAQDPYAAVVGAAFTVEPYGVGIPRDQVDMVRFVNGVLARMRADGEWLASYNRWLAPTLGRAPTPPVPQYGRTG